nr:MAG TPA: hypothetical protein [Caudoviricetes sp.]
MLWQQIIEIGQVLLFISINKLYSNELQMY